MPPKSIDTEYTVFEFTMPERDVFLQITDDILPETGVSVSIRDGDEKYIESINGERDIDKIKSQKYEPWDKISIELSIPEDKICDLYLDNVLVSPVSAHDTASFYEITVPGNDFSIKIESEDVPELWEKFNMTDEDWSAFVSDAFGEEGKYFAEIFLETAAAMIEKDIETFAKHIGAEPKVYEYLKGMEFGAYKLYAYDVPAKDDPSQTKRYPVFEVEITESTSDFFAAGTNRLVFREGVPSSTVCHLEDIEWYADYSNREKRALSAAENYINDFMEVTSDFKSFTPIKEEGHLYFGIADFILFRLYELDSSADWPTADDIKAYAEKYLGVDGDTLKISSDNLYESDGRYSSLARGGRSTSFDWISEEVRDGITVVTVRYYADFSKTAEACTVEYHFKTIDGEFSPVKTVVTQDTGYSIANFYL